MNLVITAIIIASSIWVYFDANLKGIKRGNVDGFFNIGPLGWAICCLLIWIVAFPLYLIKRGGLKEAAQNGGDWQYPVTTNSKSSTGSVVSKNIAIYWSVFCLVGVIVSMLSIGSASTELTNEYEMAGFALGSAFVFGVWFISWLVIAMPATVIYFLAGNKKETNEIEPLATHRDTKKCPYCAEDIKKEANFCRFCKKEIGKKIVTSKKKKVNKWALQGKTAIKDGEFNEAIIYFSRAIEEEGKNGDLFYARAVAYGKTNNKKKAYADINKAARLGHKKAEQYLLKTKKAALI